MVTPAVMARFRQTVTVERNSPRIHIQIEFDDLPTLPCGNPWMTYYACRFAWDNSAASITRSMLGQASGFRMERFEAPDYVEIADADQRLLIVPHGRPYHRRTGPRMLDSLLLVEGESARRFDVTLEFPGSSAAAHSVAHRFPRSEGTGLRMDSGPLGKERDCRQNAVGIGQRSVFRAGREQRSRSVIFLRATDSVVAGDRRPIGRLSCSNGQTARQCPTASSGRNGNSGTANIG